QVCGELGPIEAQLHADEQRKENPEGERAAANSADQKKHQAGPARIQPERRGPERQQQRAGGEEYQSCDQGKSCDLRGVIRQVASPWNKCEPLLTRTSYRGPVFCERHFRCDSFTCSLIS